MLSTVIAEGVMTNKEKFEEVFHIKINALPERTQCDFLLPDCEDRTDCITCPAYHFWEKEYRET